MKSLSAAIALLALSACGGASSSEPKPSATATVAAPVTLTASRAYRCSDGAAIGVDWMSDASSATLKPAGHPAVKLGSALPGAPLIGGDYILKGSATAASVNLTTPGASMSVKCDLAPSGGASPSPRPSGRHRR